MGNSSINCPCFLWVQPMSILLGLSWMLGLAIPVLEDNSAEWKKWRGLISVEKLVLASYLVSSMTCI